jgi:soluble lytic murein transglycosylase-like protein
MKIQTVIAVTFCAATLVVSAEPHKFTASQVANARLKKPGRIVITNDSRTITAHRFFGNIREALVSIRSSRSLAVRPFGSVLYNGHAPAKAPREYEAAIRDAAQHHGVDPRLVAAVVRRESAWNPNAVSRVGASGLMQLMPATARYLGVANVFDPRENIFGGTRYLRTLLDTFNGDLDLALAAYNAGPGAVAKYRGIPPYKETKAYVAAVRASYEASLRNQS